MQATVRKGARFIMIYSGGLSLEANSSKNSS